MPQNHATVRAGAQPFDYEGKTYSAGDEFSSDDPCAMLAFAKAFQDANPTTGRRNTTRNFWQNMEKACPAGNGGTPVLAPPTPATEEKPNSTEGDSAGQQGAMQPEVPPTTGGVDPPTQADGGSDPNADPSQESTRPPAGEPDASHSGEQSQTSTNAGDPVELFSGFFNLQETDLQIPNTLLPLSFVRFYRSGAAAWSSLGWNWDHNYNLYLRELSDGSIAVWRMLHEDIFTPNGAHFEPPRGTFERLEPVPGLAQVYEITLAGGTSMRFECPAGWADGERIPVTVIQDRHGNTLRFTYGADDMLAEVRDDDDRFLHFDYDFCGLLIAVSDASGRRYQYEHDEERAHLVRVTSPPTSDHPNGVSRIYHYADATAAPELRHNIVRVEDSEGNVYLENTYDDDPASFSYSRVLEQLYGGYLYQFCHTELQYVPADAVYVNIPALRVEVMNPDFGLETYTFNFRGDLLERRFRLSKDKSYRVVAIAYEFDEQGNLATTTLPDGSQEINTYDATNADPRLRGKLLRTEHTAAAGFPAPSRIIWRGRYETTYELLIEEQDESGAVTRYDYDFDLHPGALTNTGKLERITRPVATLPNGARQGSVTTLENNAKGQVTAVVLPDASRQEMEYGVAGRDASRLVRHTFDPAGLAASNEVSYDAFGFDAGIVDANGNTFQRLINALGLLEQETLPAIAGTVAGYSLHYNADRKVVAFERPKGQYVNPVSAENVIRDTFTRDVLGFVLEARVSSNSPEQRVVRTRYDYRGFPIETHYPDGCRVLRVFDERGMLLREDITGADGVGVSRTLSYARNGDLKQERDAAGTAATYSYDGFGRLSGVTWASGSVVTLAWQERDLLTSVDTTGPDGVGNTRLLNRVSYQYDERKRRTSETVWSFVDDPLVGVDVTTTFIYDSMDRVVQIIDSRGGVRTFEYDALGRLSRETDPLGNEERSTYDGNGNLLQLDSYHREPDGSISVITRRLHYDERNRCRAIEEADGSTIALDYDDRDLVILQTDHLGLTTAMQYNSFGDRITQTFDAAGLAITHRWSLDAMSRPITYIDPLGETSTYTRDGVGRVVRTDYPNGMSSACQYNSAGQVVSEALASGVQFEFGYDAANRLTMIRNIGAPATITAVPEHGFAYDGLDRMVSATLGGNRVVRHFDSRDRLVSEETLGAAIVCRFDDVAGTMEKMWPDGRTERHVLDLNGGVNRIEEIAGGVLGSGGNPIVTMIPSGPDCLGQVMCQGNLQIVGEYDERKRLVGLATTSPAGAAESAKYRYDRANRKRVEAFDGKVPAINYFEFDNKYRLNRARDGFAALVAAATTQAEHDAAIDVVRIASAGAARTEEFDYDAADARLRRRETGMLQRTYAYAPGHRVQNDGMDNYSYTTDGTLRAEGPIGFDCDAFGRITAVKAGANVLCTVSYDSLGRPSSLTEAAGPTTTFNYLGAGLEQENRNGAPSRQKTLHPVTGLPLAYHVPGATYYTLFDARRNLVGLADTSGHLIEFYRYRPFGTPSLFNANGASIAVSQVGIEPIFGGQRYLPSVGLYLSTRRVMNPAHAFFLSADPAGYASSASLYVYAAQNPIDLVDPEGEFAFLAILAVMAIGALIAGGFNATRQTIQMSEDPEKRRRGFSWGELGLSMGIGAVAAPVLVAAPELAIPLSAYGVSGGIGELRKGNYRTGAFDIVTSLAPFGFKGVRSAAFGRGSLPGMALGEGPTASWSTRTGRFNLIDQNLQTLRPSPFGRRVGLGFAKNRADIQGHSAVVIEKESGGLWFMEKNAQRLPDGSKVAQFNTAEAPPESYPLRGDELPFEYETMRVPRAAAEEAASYAKARLLDNGVEPFDRNCANCSHFAADVLGRAGFKGLGNGRASGLWSDFTNLSSAVNMTYAAPAWVKLPSAPSSSK